MMKQIAQWMLITLVGGFLAAGCSEVHTALPDGRSEVNAPEVADVAVATPLNIPDLVNGSELYQEYCSDCHEPQIFPQRLSDFLFSGLAKTDLQNSSPADWYKIITQGLPQVGMPDFSKLSNQQRWNIAGYLVVKNTTETQLTNSQLVYQNLCQTCHGTNGAGDGAQAIANKLSMPNWQNQLLLYQESSAELASVIKNGKGRYMPKFAVMLKDDQINAMTDYLRLITLQTNQNHLSSDYFTDFDLLNTKAVEALGTININGKVINGSGGDIPENSTVFLSIYASDQVYEKLAMPMDINGNYQLVDIPWNPGFSYLTSIQYNGITYNSELVQADTLIPDSVLYLPLLVYDDSTNTSFLHALKMRISFDFSDTGWVHVSESILISNPTSLVIVPENETTPVLSFILPDGARDVTFPEGNQADRFKMTTKGFGDWQPVMPGNGHQVLVDYTLPFDRQRTIPVTIPIPVDSVMVVVKSKGVEMSGPGMETTYVQTTSGQTLAFYNGPAVKAGGKLSLVFATEGQIQSTWIGALFFVVILILASLWILYNRRREQKKQLATVVAENNESVDTILDAIIALDDRYKAGELQAETYQQLRAELVKQLEQDQRKILKK